MAAMTTEKPSAEVEDQMLKWVDGESVHIGTKTEGQCCPDFSCCKPEFLWPKERREFFRDHPKARSEMLFQSLSALIADTGKNVYLTGSG